MAILVAGFLYQKNKEAMLETAESLSSFRTTYLDVNPVPDYPEFAQDWASYECYSVSWRPKSGLQKCTSFSIRKYGEKKVFKLAVAHRRKMMREIHGWNFYRTLGRMRAQSRA